ncbi:MAG: hypothetical protein ACRD4Q_04990 [Candidatus Acidiferrales bacterium]
MRAPIARLCSGQAAPSERIGDVRGKSGELITRVDRVQGDELVRRGLVMRRGRHFLALNADAIRLWVRSRAGGSHTTLERETRTMHRALRPLLGAKI